MLQERSKNRTVRNALCTAAAVALVVGAAGTGQSAMAGSSQEATVDVPRKHVKAVAKAEKAVSKSPDSVSNRLDLAQAYLTVGRFESAATTYEDAQHLGDKSARTALSLALAYVGAGQNRKAVSTLDQWRDSIPASDLGLAFSLAGETSRGVAILADTLRAGDDSAKLRQNLAYAYALDGRWREARLMASQDVPADELDQRISTWATQGRPEDFRKRVASLLDVPLRSDIGQPQHLALNRASDVEFAATDAPVQSLAAYDSELPADDGSADFYVAEAVQPGSLDSGISGDVQAPASDFDQAFAQAEPETRFVSNPVVQAVPERTARVTPVEAVTSSSDKPRTISANIVRPADKDCTHLVQLGSFSSPENAERAWKIFLKRNPTLHSFDKTITRAKVRGKMYWRVCRCRL